MIFFPWRQGKGLNTLIARSTPDDSFVLFTTVP